MSEIRARAADPQLLLEAARVFNAAGRDYRSAAEVVSDLALQARDNAEPRVRQAIIGDAAALRLSGRVPGGYRAALELLDPIGDREAEDHDGRLHVLRALANGQKYKASPQEQRDQLRDKIIHDLEIAMTQDPSLRRSISHFWQLPPEGEDPEDDLRAVYLDNPQLFEEMINPPSAGPISPQDATAPDQTGTADHDIGAPGGATGAAGTSRDHGA